jgi:molybdate transport system substrate-binding protein
LGLDDAPGVERYKVERYKMERDISGKKAAYYRARNRKQAAGAFRPAAVLRLAAVLRERLTVSVRRTALFMIAFWLPLAACSSPRPQESSREITVAAAANLTNVFEELGKQFTSETGIRVVFSFGATADLSKQIENAGPFDVFASADVKHVDELVNKGLIAADTRALYARGRLVLWKPPESRVAFDRIEDLASADVKFIAVAKPDLAPYGRAAVETLRSLNLWLQVEPKIVYAQNVTQAMQYAVSGNAELAFLPLALMKAGEGQYIEVDQRLHQPIDQAMGVVQASNKQEAARRFAGFVLSREGQDVLVGFGYLTPHNVE